MGLGEMYDFIMTVRLINIQRERERERWGPRGALKMAIESGRDGQRGDGRSEGGKFSTLAH